MSPWRSFGGGATVRLKICCTGSIDEAWLAINHGRSALGVVSRMPSGPGPIAEELMAEIVPRVPAGIATFLLTSETADLPPMTTAVLKCCQLAAVNSTSTEILIASPTTNPPASSA